MDESEELSYDETLELLDGVNYLSCCLVLSDCSGEDLESTPDQT